MTISSPVFEPDSTVPVRHTCAGDNVSPPLKFSGIPKNAKSLVLIVEDMDAEPEPWVHWLVFNIPPEVEGSDEGRVPAGGTEGHANGGTPGYEGPCTKYFSGTHHYHFRLYALDKVLSLPKTADKKQVLAAMKGHEADTAVLVGLAEGTKET